ncbi:putative L-type lectin-domain containing receptor kinase S.4 [Cocos nucifera]|uniref:Putative L-type lectin-domain containing receptor kinase S.4 n=1 Tax=Cocos nucifera TaxID=13894 RepID=A0A8K0NDA8_COCNU|nr:putative L-type lectin-domain containing receptor kinase S.4 [Cocos nucifera]
MLKKATDGFSEDNLVWRGERGEIYKGRLRDGVEIDIKVQRGRISAESRRVFDEECWVLVQLRHKNLVKVLGWCDQRKLRAVVMQRMWVCSVEGWLLGSPPWKQRLEVSMEVVEAMCYLQEWWSSIGYDLRTRNLMLTDDNEPLILKLNVGDQNTESRIGDQQASARSIQRRRNGIPRLVEHALPWS